MSHIPQTREDLGIAVGDTVVFANLSGTNTGDNATNTQYHGLLSNAVHTTKSTFQAGDDTYGLSTGISIELGTNAGNAGAIKLWGAFPNCPSYIQATNDNLHVDAHDLLLLNYYSGSGIAFGSGSNTIVAVMGPDGDLWKGSSDNTGSKYWHAGNDGAGTGLHADLLDNQHGSYYLDIDNHTYGSSNPTNYTAAASPDSHFAGIDDALGVLQGKTADGDRGDITVSSNGTVWTVKDDSHNHSSVTGDFLISDGNLVVAGPTVGDEVKIVFKSALNSEGLGYDIGYEFGGLDYDVLDPNIKANTFTGNAAVGSGFWWGDGSHTKSQGAMALTVDGKLTVAHSIRLGYGESDTTEPGSTYDLDVSGTALISTSVRSGNFIDHNDENRYCNPSATSQLNVIKVFGRIEGAGTQLVLNAGEAAGAASGQSSEIIYLNAESGIQVNSSPDNWGGGSTNWGNRHTATICDSSGNSSLPNNLTVGGTLTTTGSVSAGSFSTTGDIRANTGTAGTWGHVKLHQDSGWNSSSYPTIGSHGGSNGELIMLKSPHIPFVTHSKVLTDTGRAGIRCAVDTSASSWWDIGLYGDAFHIYRNASSKRILTIASSGDATFSDDVTVSGALTMSSGSTVSEYLDTTFSSSTFRIGQTSSVDGLAAVIDSGNKKLLQYGGTQFNVAGTYDIVGWASTVSLGVSIDTPAETFRIEPDTGNATFSGIVDINSSQTASNGTNGALTVTGGIATQDNIWAAGYIISERASSTDSAFAGRIDGDTTARWRVYADGKNEWSNGTTADASIDRVGAGRLEINDHLWVVDGGMSVTPSTAGSHNDNFGLGVAAEDAYLHIVSTHGATWGSTIRLSQVDDSTGDYENSWDLIRQTNDGGLGNGALYLRYGSNTNPTSNSEIVEFATNGTVTFSGSISASNLSGTNTGDQNAASVSVAASPSNYTAGSSNVESHLAGIDSAIGTVAAAGVSDGDKGDIVVSSSGSVWTVEDDSHNHIIANIDGLQAALDGKEASRSVMSIAEGETGTATTERTINANNLKDIIEHHASGVNAATATKLQTSRTISLGGVLSGSTTFDGSGNVTITASHTSDPTITLTGDVTGSGTMTNLGSVSITADIKTSGEINVGTLHVSDGEQIKLSGSDSRNKIDILGIGNGFTLGADTGYTYGGLTDYATINQVLGLSDGWWWGYDGNTNAQGAMALTALGKLTVAHSMRLGYGTADTTTPGSSYVLDVDGPGKFVGDIEDSKGNIRSIPQNAKSAAYTLVLSDAGKHIFHPSADTTARTWTIPSNASVAYDIGTAITFINQNGAGDITIAITSDTMRLAGDGTTGSRTLAANGVATAIKVTSTEWIISGTGLS